MLKFYCDGSTRVKNQKGVDNIGGWGVVCLKETDCGLILDSFDCATNECTTNNREELKALIYCLSTIISYDYSPKDCIIYSDSAYVVKMFNEWIHTWSKNGWKNSKKQTVENLDLVQQIYSYIENSFFGFNVQKCDGHAGDIGNELADALATANYKRFIKLCKEYDVAIHDNDFEWIERKMDEID